LLGLWLLNLTALPWGHPPHPTGILPLQARLPSQEQSWPAQALTATLSSSSMCLHYSPSSGPPLLSLPWPDITLLDSTGWF
jgi:hypothetical protein